MPDYKAKVLLDDNSGGLYCDGTIQKEYKHQVC